MKGKLFLIPTAITEGIQEVALTTQTKADLLSIHHFLVENIRTARRYLSSLHIYDSIEPLTFEVLDKNTSVEDVRKMLKPLHDGKHIGVLSESGCPGIADPGALAIRVAHENAVTVVPLVGPSSILLALMASGLNGQQFAFNGYLPIDANEASKAIRTFEKESRSKGQTQIFIETPYRNKSIFQTLVKTLSENTLLTVACDLTGSAEFIKTTTVNAWKKTLPDLQKIPTVFLFLAQ